MAVLAADAAADEAETNPNSFVDDFLRSRCCFFSSLLHLAGLFRPSRPLDLERRRSRLRDLAMTLYNDLL
jgi:hypothetical protein